MKHSKVFSWESDSTRRSHDNYFASEWEILCHDQHLLTWHGSRTLFCEEPSGNIFIERVKEKEVDQPDLSLPRPPLVEWGEGPLAVRHKSLDSADTVDRQIND